MFSYNYHYILLNLYIDITTSMSLALSTSILFHLLMQSLNGLWFLILIFLVVLFATALAAAMFGTVIVLLQVCAHHYNHIDWF